MKCALVVGGSGMLSQVSIWLAQQHYRVYVIGRSVEKMNRLLRQADSYSQIIPIYADYTNDEQFVESIHSLLGKNSHIKLIVSWIHSTAPRALQTLINMVEEEEHPFHVYHVLGSKANLPEIKKNLHLSELCTYHQVQLGYIREGRSQRWLSHDEISQGVIDSIKQEKEVYTVGTLS
ncbi:MAG TPA: short-chain dehydrogenase [Metabacillus sp.]|nr:short-chain dehydrogenase [Metabacillus sp.]